MEFYRQTTRRKAGLFRQATHSRYENPKPVGCVFALSFSAGITLFENRTEAQSPKLSIRTSADRRVRISCPAAAGNFALESASPLANPPVWKTVANSPAQEGLDFVLTFDASQGDRYFRLRGAALPTLTTISETSPASGETGVAVTRETIVRFSTPLDPGTQITPAQFYAEFGGRRILSRVELSSDRRKATLFYLENLPSSARVRVTLNSDALADAQAVSLTWIGTVSREAPQLLTLKPSAQRP
ncbi:MAG: hypothetical protein EXS31_17900 [Pedosphaera sp.]|nr:hypothetical protein [Pedosphaera sp.]